MGGVDSCAKGGPEECIIESHQPRNMLPTPSKRNMMEHVYIMLSSLGFNNYILLYMIHDISSLWLVCRAHLKAHPRLHSSAAWIRHGGLRPAAAARRPAGAEMASHAEMVAPSSWALGDWRRNVGVCCCGRLSPKKKV